MNPDFSTIRKDVGDCLPEFPGILKQKNNGGYEYGNV